jgi:hypothetical protein
VLRYNCALNPIVSTEQGMEGATRVPLLPGHGFLRLPRGQRRLTDASDAAGAELLHDSDRPIRKLSGRGFPMQWQISYLPWSGAYFADKGALHPSQMFWPNGESRSVPAPELLVSLGPGVGAGSAVATKAGTVWNFIPWRALWRMQGLYLQPERGPLLRVDDAFVPGIPGTAVSPDGCSLFYVRRAGDPNNEGEPMVPTVMNLCEGARRG